MLKIMDDGGILLTKVDIMQWSELYNIKNNLIRNALGIGALQIIDGKPELWPTKEGLILVRDAGLLHYIEDNWESWFDEEKRKGVISEIQSGTLYEKIGAVKSSILSLTSYNERALHDYLDQLGGDNSKTLKDIIAVGGIFITNKFFEEIPDRHNLTKHTVHTKLEAEEGTELEKQNEVPAFANLRGLLLRLFGGRGG